MIKKVGIPRGMLYYEFYHICENFFCELGYKVISSLKLTKIY